MIKCDHCYKTFKTDRGLTRQISVKHTTEQQAEQEEKAAKKLHPLALKKVVFDCVKKVNSDQCYSQEIRTLFDSFIFSSSDALNLWKKIIGPILHFDGDIEKFHADSA